jgi:hypothetical protein
MKKPGFSRILIRFYGVEKIDSKWSFGDFIESFSLLIVFFSLFFMKYFVYELSVRNYLYIVSAPIIIGAIAYSVATKNYAFGPASGTLIHMLIALISASLSYVLYAWFCS